jgi:hypothetical protein
VDFENIVSLEVAHTAGLEAVDKDCKALEDCCRKTFNKETILIILGKDWDVALYS